MCLQQQHREHHNSMECSAYHQHSDHGASPQDNPSRQGENLAVCAFSSSSPSSSVFLQFLLPLWCRGKMSAWRVVDLGLIRTFTMDFFSMSSHTSDWKIGTLVATLPGAWCYRIITGTGWPGVSVLWLGEIARLICNCCLGVKMSKQPTNNNSVFFLLLLHLLHLLLLIPFSSFIVFFFFFFFL